MSVARKISVLCLVVALSAGLAGCFSAKFLYNQADWLTVWYIDSLFDLDSEQKDQLREMVSRNFEWHRRNQLPRYAQFCAELDREMAGNITPAMLERRYNQMLEIWDEFLVHVLPDVATFLRGLTDEQVEAFIDNVEEKNREIWDDYAGSTAQARIEKRQKTAIESMERFTGRLNNEQKALIRNYIATLHDNSEEWMEGRREWQLEFLKLLRERPAEPEFTARLRDLMLNPNDVDSAAYRRKVDENRQILFEMFSDVSNQLTEKQQAHLSQRLRNYAEDFELLAEQV